MDPADLYGLPLDRFIAERAALAKALRAEGRRDEAAAVARLRKPSVAAWAVNQVVRTQGKAVRDLYDAGDALGKAQADLLAGKGNPKALRNAADREREAVAGLVDAARGLLTSDGHELSPSVIERVSETLNAAALDPDAREQLRDGTLERELRHVGFGLTSAIPSQPRERKTERPRKAPAANKQRKTRKAAPDRDREAERRQAAARRAERKRAKDAETAARRRLERAQRALAEAEERHERAAVAAAKAADALAAARAETADALAEHEGARSRLEAAAAD